MLLAFLKCLRPKQWTKNLLLFAGLVFTRQMDSKDSVLKVCVAFAIFCAISGVVYIINDVLDVEKDRQHPKKCKRPIASGQISSTAALLGAMVLLAFALVGAWHITLPFFICAVIYVALVAAYSVQLKHIVILDIMAIAMGFVVRAMAGVEALHVPGHPVKVTPYFILTTLFLALFLAVGKRRNELVMMQEKAGSTRKVLADYSTEYLDVLLTLATTGVIGSYAAWATAGEFARGANGGTYTMAFTMPFVLYGIFRYLWLVLKRDEGEAPEVLLLKDRPLLITVLLWLVTVVTILWFFGPGKAPSPGP